MTRNDTTNSDRGEPRIARLSDLSDWELKDDQPDVRGWNVVGADGTRVGDVHELLADPSARRVRYLDIEVADGDASVDRHVAVPIGAARIDENAKNVTISAAGTGIHELPRYSGGAPDRAYESRVASCYGCDETGLRTYEHPAFDDREFYRR